MDADKLKGKLEEMVQKGIVRKTYGSVDIYVINKDGALTKKKTMGVTYRFDSGLQKQV